MAPGFVDLLLNALEQCNDTVVATDSAGIITYWNRGAERILQHKAVDMVGSSAFRRLEPATADEARRIFADVVAGRPYEGPWSEQTKAGSRVKLRMRVFAHRDSTGAVTGVIGLGRLDTESEDAVEDQALWSARLAEWRQLQALGLVASGLAHDLNNQVTMIGHTAELAGILGDASRHPEFFLQIQQLCERARHTIERIQAFSREATGRQSPIDLGEVTAAGIRLLRASVHSHLRLVFSAEPGEFNIEGNANQIQEILIHLVRAAEPGGGTLELALRHGVSRAGGGDGGTDVNGETGGDAPGAPAWWFRLPGGAAPDFWRRLMEGDFSPAGSEAEEVQQLAGRIHALLAVHGCFWRKQGDFFCLEWGNGSAGRAPGVAPIPAAHAPAVGGAELRGLHVAVVEDEPRELDALREALQRRGARVSAFGAAADFMRWLPGGAPPDLLVVDQVLGDHSGEDVAARLLADAPGTPVLMIGGCIDKTATTIAGHRVRTLAKPFVLEELVAILQAMTPGGGGRV